MDTKHTPGPWLVRSTGCVGTDNMMVANVYPMEDQNLEEHDANARLIAAAPELLVALQTMVEFAESPDFDGAPSDAAVIAARDVIAKATGG